MRWSAGRSRRRVAVALVAVLATIHMAVDVAPASAGAGESWIRQFGTGDYDEATGVAVGPDGSVYVAGFTEDEIAGGGGSQGHFDGFLRKYTASGAVEWTRQFGTVKGDYTYAAAAGADGNVYVVGETGLRVDQGGDGDFDVFVVQYDSDGTAGWTDTFGGATFDAAFGVAVGSDGSVYVVGWTDDELAGGGGHQGGFDAFVRKYDSAGAVQWTRQFGTSELDSAGAAAVAADGSVYVAGTTSGALPGGGGSAGFDDAFVRKFNADGDEQWTRQFGTSALEGGSSVAVGPDGTVYVGGQTGGALPGGGGHAGNFDGYLRAYDAAGTVKWTRQFGTAAVDRVRSVSVGPDGKVFVAGDTAGALAHGGGSAGGFDAYVRWFSPGGTAGWTRQFGTGTDDIAVGVAARPGGGVYAVGYTDGALSGGGGSSGGVDAFAVSLEVETPPTVGLVDPTQGLWHLRNLEGLITSFYFGNPGDVPFVGDWNCNGIQTPGLYRQSDGFVYLRNSNTQGIADITFFFGNPGDVPIAGDFNGNGCDTVSIYRPGNQTFYIINVLGQDGGGLGAAQFSYVFGNPGDKPFTGDFNGNGVTTVGLHRESTGLVYYRNTHTQGNADNQFYFGNSGDRFVAGDWNANGVDSPAVFRPSNTTFYFRFTNTQGNANAQFVWGSPGWLPVAGNLELG